MKIRFLSAVLSILIVTGISYADDAAYQKHIAYGISAIEINNYKDAVDEFREALKERPDDRAATLYLGIAQSRSMDKEAGSTLKKSLALNPENPRTTLELGIFYFNQSAFSEAEDYFNNTIKLAPKTEFSEMAEKYLRVIKQGSAEKRWALNISLGGQYDSNVPIIADNMRLPEDVSHKSDWRAILYLNGRYTLSSSKTFESSAGYSLYQSLHSRLSDFNITQHLVDLKGVYSITPSVKLSGIYSFEYVYLGGDDYDYAHAFSPSLTLSQGKGVSTVIDYRYRYSHFMNSDLYTTNSFRTGSNNLIGITQNFPIGNSIAVKVGYAYDNDSTEKDYWDYSGNKVFLGLRFSMPYRTLLDLYGEYYRTDYDGADPFSDKKRNDTSRTFSASLTKGFSDRYSVTLGQFYTKNSSNIDVYDYTRAITSLFLNVRF